MKPPGERPKVPDDKEFIKLVKKAFLQRRKALRNALQPLVSGEEAAAALAAAGLGADARAQELCLDEFVNLAWALNELKKV